MKLPLIIINFKAYAEGTGKNAIKLAKICQDLSKKNDVNIIIAPQDVDIYRIRSKLKIPIFAQSIEPIEPGAHTGHELALAAKESGASGTLINHSENKMSVSDIKRSVELARKYGLKTVVCTPDLSVTKKVAKFRPDFIAFEVPELIGTGKAISKVKPKSVKDFVEILNKIGSEIIPLCGAGISTGEDVRISLELGVKGVIVSSAFVKSNKPKDVLKDLINGLKKK
ncbi:MAG: triose-phosphate isomerase [Candidatus Aenigmatarchaeota archaeon]